MLKKSRRILNAVGYNPCEICREDNILVQHHIQGRKIKMPNNPTNIANVCSNCHLEVHRGLIIIEKKVLTTLGYTLLWHYKGEESISGEDSSPYVY
jgi:hypothetical protein